MCPYPAAKIEYGMVSVPPVSREFMRDKTYWPQLCLVQIAGPEEAAAIDSLAPGIDLAPLFELLPKTRSDNLDFSLSEKIRTQFSKEFKVIP